MQTEEDEMPAADIRDRLRRHDMLANMALILAVKGNLVGYDTLEATTTW